MEKKSKFERISDNKIEKIGDMIIAMLYKGNSAKWKQPWLNVGTTLPAQNLDYHKPFRGINDFFLNLAVVMEGWKTPYFLTFDQIKKMGLHLNIVDYVKAIGGKDVVYVLKDGKEMLSSELIKLHDAAKRKKGKAGRAAMDEYKKLTEGMRKVCISIAKYEEMDDKTDWKACREPSTPVFQFHFVYYDKDGIKITAKQYDELDDEEKEHCRRYPQLMCFDEWNIDQTDMKDVMPEKYAKLVTQAAGENKKIKHKVNAKDEVLDYIIDGNHWRCPIKFGGDRAFYRPSADTITLPERKQFFKASSFYGTALHEMAHSNKPETKRDYGSTGFGSDGYATEELVAELTAAIMCHDLGIEKTIDEEHIAYVNAWMKSCRDKDVIRTILDDLMTSVRYGMNWYEKSREGMKVGE